METEQQKPVEMTDVVDLAEPAQEDKNAAEDLVFVFQTAQEETVEMMVVAVPLVEFALQLKPAPMVSVLVQPQLNVQEEFVEATEPEEVVVLAPTDKDAEEDFANAIMTAMKEIVEMPFNLLVPTLVFAPQEVVELAPQDFLALQKECVLLLNLVKLVSELLTALPEPQLCLQALLLSPRLLSQHKL